MHPSYNGENVAVDVARAELTAGRAELLDVREKDETAAMSLKLDEVHYCPLTSMSDTVPGKVPKDLGSRTPLLLLCRGGARSRKAADIFMSNGRKKVACVEGGITAWQSKFARDVNVVSSLPHP